jgi:hypothetical protein
MPKAKNKRTKVDLNATITFSAKGVSIKKWRKPRTVVCQISTSDEKPRSIRQQVGL